MSLRHLVLITACACGGCSGLFASHQPAPTVYALRAATPAPAGASPASRIEATLVVARPRARPGFDSDRIAVAFADHRVDAYAGTRWQAPLPDMLEALLVDRLRAGGAFTTVIGEHSGFLGRYLLQAEIREFTADYAAGGAAPVVRVTLGGEFGTAAGTGHPASIAGHGEVRALADRQRAVIAAFQAACEEALGELVAGVEAAGAAAERAAGAARSP
jgi:ABC-type uncharacterized transport system auxiliary subunit